jgi:ABC-type Na+ efflux pump permease subunit
MLRAKETLLWIFLMPGIFFFFIGTITGGFGSTSTGRKDPLVLDVSPQAGFLAQHLERRLGEIGFRLLSAETVDPESRAPRLAVPAAFTDSVLAGNPVSLPLTRKKSGIAADYDQFRVLRGAYRVLADLVLATEVGGRPTADELAILAELPPRVTLEVAPAGQRRKIPTGFEQAIPGTTVMFTLLVLLTSGAVLLVLERKQGLLRRLASAPLSRGTVILGKWGGRLALGMIQLGFAMALGTVLFGMRWGPDVPMLLVVLLVYGALVAFLGILLGNLARTEGQAIGIGVLASNVLAALGGCWWPIEITPPWMQKLALAFPTGWAMDALHRLVSFGAGPTSVIPHLVVMLLATIVAGWLAARTFRFH